MERIFHVQNISNLVGVSGLGLFHLAAVFCHSCAGEFSFAVDVVACPLSGDTAETFFACPPCGGELCEGFYPLALGAYHWVCALFFPCVACAAAIHSRHNDPNSYA